MQKKSFPLTSHFTHRYIAKFVCAPSRHSIWQSQASESECKCEVLIPIDNLMGTALCSQYKAQSNVSRIHSHHWIHGSFQTPEEYMTNGESKAMPLMRSIGALLICCYEIQKLANSFQRQTKFGRRLTKTPLCVKRGACKKTKFTCAEYKWSGTATSFLCQWANFPQWTWHKPHTAEWATVSGPDGHYTLAAFLRDQMYSRRNTAGCCVGDLLNSLEMLPWKLFVWILMESFSGL